MAIQFKGFIHSIIIHSLQRCRFPEPQRYHSNHDRSKESCVREEPIRSVGLTHREREGKAFKGKLCIRLDWGCPAFQGGFGQPFQEGGRDTGDTSGPRGRPSDASLNVDVSSPTMERRFAAELIDDTCCWEYATSDLGYARPRPGGRTGLGGTSDLIWALLTLLPRSIFGSDFECSILDDDVRGLDGPVANDDLCDAPGIPLNILSWLDQDAVDRLLPDARVPIASLDFHPAARPNPNTPESKRGSKSNLRR